MLYDTGGSNPSAEIDIAEVAALIADGTLADETDVWTQGMSVWVPLGSVKSEVLTRIGL